MLIKKQTDDSPSEKDHIEGRAVYLNALRDAVAVLGTNSDEISCSPLETYALQVKASNQLYQTDFLVILGGKCRFAEIWRMYLKLKTPY